MCDDGGTAAAVLAKSLQFAVVISNTSHMVGLFSFPGWIVSQLLASCQESKQRNSYPCHFFVLCSACQGSSSSLFLNRKHPSRLFLIFRDLSPVGSEKSALLPAICPGRCNYRLANSAHNLRVGIFVQCSFCECLATLDASLHPFSLARIDMKFLFIIKMCLVYFSSVLPWINLSRRV